MLYQLSYASGFVPFLFFTATGETFASVSLPATVTLRAGDGTRTRDIKLGRLALYQLSYSRTTSNCGQLRTADCGQLHYGLRQLQTYKKIRPLYLYGGGRIRTFVGVSRQIYSLLPLAT